MKEKKEKIKMWMKKHKQQLVAAGVTIFWVAMYLGLQKEKEMEEIKGTLIEPLNSKGKALIYSNILCTDAIGSLEASIIPNDVAGKCAHNVSEHIRNLPDGWKPSPEKVAMALKHGYTLGEGQTLVEAYRTGGIAV